MPGGIGLGRKCRKAFRPKATKMTPNKMRTMMITIFMNALFIATAKSGLEVYANGSLTGRFFWGVTPLYLAWPEEGPPYQRSRALTDQVLYRRPPGNNSRANT